MQRLRVPVKMGMMGLFLLVPLALLLVVTVQGARSSIATAEAEIEGARLARSISAVVGLAQKHRGLTNRALSGDAAAAQALPKVREAFGAALQALDAAVANPHFFHVGDWLAASTPPSVSRRLPSTPAPSRACVACCCWWPSALACCSIPRPAPSS
jgi:hypothetical protein